MSGNRQPQPETDSLGDKIRVAAYYKWQQAGRPDGRHLDFWCAAEQEFAGARQEAAPPSSDDRPNPHREMVVRPQALPAPDKRAANRSNAPAVRRPAR